MPHSLEPSSDEFRRWVDLAVQRIVGYVETLPQQPAVALEGGPALARSLAEPLPERGESIESLLALLFDRALPSGFGTAGPGYLAYIPGGGLLQSAVADLIGDAINRYVGVFAGAPALSQLEANVVRWFGEIVGYPPSARGFLTTGGSLANFSAVFTARRERLPEHFLGGTIYTSDQAHYSVQKAAMLAGFPAANVREIASDGRFRIRIDALRDRIAADRTDGLTPFLIVAHAGSTNTGAVDDLATLADLARDEGLWLHVDAAYGGFFLLTERGRRAMRGIERADSVVLDPHKGMFLPYGTGSLLVRDGGALARAHSMFAHYMPQMQEADDLVDFCQISPELTRSFRGLRVWLPVKLHGIDAFRRCLDEKLDLAEWATVQLRAVPGIEIVAEPQLSLVAFRLVKPGLEPAALNALNRDFLRRVNQRNRVHLTPTTLGDRFVLRICVLSFRTHMDRMQACLEDIRGAAAETGGTAVRRS